MRLQVQLAIGNEKIRTRDPNGKPFELIPTISNIVTKFLKFESRFSFLTPRSWCPLSAPLLLRVQSLKEKDALRSSGIIR
ncbi:hypothetical protein TNCV_2031821 [Trichonephila clavipes]|nr:hypothetical protein TNCV_2031821 [Trichonephila clavipes]